MPCPLLSSLNLLAGITTFRRHHKWRQDFHNRFYANITAAAKIPASLVVPSVGAYWPVGAKGPSIWHDIVYELWFWRALRPHKQMCFHGHPLLPNLRVAYAALGGGLPHVVLPPRNPPQPLLANLFNAAMALKPTTTGSAVFPSKCCHMLLPWEFPIWDNQFAGNTNQTRVRMLKALDDWDDLDGQTRNQLHNSLTVNPDYWSYRKYLLLAWDTLPTTQKLALIKILNHAILTAPAPYAFGHLIWGDFPYRTKIPELCLA